MKKPSPFTYRPIQADKANRPGVPCLHCIVRDALIDDMLDDGNTGHNEQALQLGEALGDIIAQGREIGWSDAQIYVKCAEAIASFEKGLSHSAALRKITLQNILDDACTKLLP